MEYWQIIILACVGITAGWLNVMAGGGSLLTVPAMLFMDMPAPVANGTNRIAILAQNITAVYAFFRNGFSDFKLSLTLSFAASIGAVVGAMVGVRLEGEWFGRILALVMIAVMIIMITGKEKISNQDTDGEPRHLILGNLCMVGAGFWGGFIQIGVGFILMPILHKIMGLYLVRVNMHKVFVVLVYTLVALSVFATQLELMWWAGLGLAIGNSIGGWFGAHTTIVKGEIWIKRIMYVTLTLFSIKLLFF
ncbi:MAG: sulfite exporter TauE/SafE family protein [Gammaproteobacteria bacterium]|nr:sulfite exporter TauE/SafE family protein [Gammaproteobacteria bacterium]